MIQQEFPLVPHHGLLLPFLQQTHKKRYHLASNLKSSISTQVSVNLMLSEHIMSVIAKQPLPAFLRLPPEIRQQIYGELYHDQPSSLLALLTVHPRVLEEIRPWIFKLPITFNGQSKLFEWLSRVDHGFLSNVGEIRFKLHDIDTEKIMGALGERLRRARMQDPFNPIGRPYDEACGTELYHIKVALQKFKNLKSLTLLDNTSADPQAPPSMLKTFVALVLADLPLVSFSIPHQLLHDMDYPNSYQVQRLHITDHKFITWPDFPHNKFSQLSELKVCGGCHSLGRFTIPGGACRKTSMYWENLPALQELTLCLYDYNASDSNRDEVGIRQVISRWIVHLETHAKGLRTFKLWCNAWVDPNDGNPTLSNLRRLAHMIQSSCLAHVETGYWWTPSINRYPESIVTIGIRFETNYEQYPHWIQKFNHDMDPACSTFFADHPNLMEILLYLPQETRQKLSPVSTCQSTVTKMCRDHGVRLRIIYEDFACDHTAEIQRRKGVKHLVEAENIDWFEARTRMGQPW